MSAPKVEIRRATETYSIISILGLPFNTHPLYVYAEALDFESFEIDGTIYDNPRTP